MAASCQNVKTNHLNKADENKVKTFSSAVMEGGGGWMGLGLGEGAQWTWGERELYTSLRSSSRRPFVGGVTLSKCLTQVRHPMEICVYKVLLSLVCGR